MASREYMLAWRAKAKEDPEWLAKKREKNRADYTLNKQKRLAAMRRWRKANQERVRAIGRRYYERHREYEAERKRQLDPEIRAERRRRYDASHRPVMNAKAGRRRAWKKLATIGEVDYAAVIRDANGMCGICGDSVDGHKTHIDHIVPLAKGGSHTQGNLQLAHARCNSRKGAQLLERVG